MKQHLRTTCNINTFRKSFFVTDSIMVFIYPGDSALRSDNYQIIKKDNGREELFKGCIVLAQKKDKEENPNKPYVIEGYDVVKAIVRDQNNAGFVAKHNHSISGLVWIFFIFKYLFIIVNNTIRICIFEYDTCDTSYTIRNNTCIKRLYWESMRNIISFYIVVRRCSVTKKLLRKVLILHLKSYIFRMDSGLQWIVKLL